MKHIFRFLILLLICSGNNLFMAVIGVEELKKAISNGDYDIVEYMVEDENADVNAVDAQGKPPLFFALEKGNSKIADFLVKSGAKIDVMVKNKPMLAIFADLGKLKAVQFLLKNGAYPNTEILVSSSEYKSKPNTRSIDRKKVTKVTPIYYAVVKGNLPITKEFLNYKTDIYGINNDYIYGRTRRGLSQNYSDWFYLPATGTGYSALDTAVRKGKANIVKFLLGSDSDPNGICQDSYTQLTFAANSGNVAVTKALLEDSRVNVNARDGFGKSAYEHAVEGKRSKIKSVLVSAGATSLVSEKKIEEEAKKAKEEKAAKDKKSRAEEKFGSRYRSRM